VSTLLHGSGYNVGESYGVPLVVHYRVDLQSAHGFRCYDNIPPNAKCQRVLVLALCPVLCAANNFYLVLCPIAPDRGDATAEEMLGEEGRDRSVELK